MKALVISDSHGASAYMARLMEQVAPQEKPQTLVFCGDGLGDIRPYAHLFDRVLSVRGNCDFAAPPDTPATLTARLNGTEVFITHGHHYHVKRQTDTLLYAALEAGAQVACHGHTHAALAQWQRGVLLLNPGALQDGRFAWLTIGPNGQISFELCRL